MEQNLLQRFPVVVRTRGRQFHFQVPDEFVLVVVEPLSILDCPIEGDLLGNARGRWVAPDLEVRAEVVECASVTAQKPLVLVSDAAEHGPQRAGHAVPAHAGPVDVVVCLVGEDAQRVPEHRCGPRRQGHREADLASTESALGAIDAVVSAGAAELAPTGAVGDRE
jgi:hypothetical protein